MSNDRFEKFKKMAKDEFDVSVVKADWNREEIWNAIRELSDIRAGYNLFDDKGAGKYFALSLAIKALKAVIENHCDTEVHRMKMNEAGKELYKIWEQNYHKENDKRGGNYANGDIVEGWCIIDNYDYVKTLTDECGLLIFGYDDSVIDTVDEWIDLYGADDVIFMDCDGKGYTCAEIKNELLKYFE